jgi:hypothetical protein
MWGVVDLDRFSVFEGPLGREGKQERRPDLAGSGDGLLYSRDHLGPVRHLTAERILDGRRHGCGAQ